MVTAVDFQVVTSYLLQEEPLQPSQFKPLNVSLHRFLGAFNHFFRNRALFITKAGHIGLGPLRMQSGDNVMIPFGSRCALILRAQSDGDFTLVGQAYCDGFMKGEALLGPFPDNWDLIWNHDEDTGHLNPMYINSSTGIFQPEDPRLGELPTGWRRQAHSEEDKWTKFVHDESGEVLEGGWDPRLSVEALMERGLKLEYFNII
jgi:hypothetical protein